MQEKLLSAGGFPYFPQGNPGRFMCACLCSAYTVKANVFWTPRALLSFLKCCSARWAQPDLSHAGVNVPLLHSTHGLARARCPQWALRQPEILGHCPRHPFLTLGWSFWLEKEAPLGQRRRWLLEVLEDVRSKRAQAAKSSHCYSCLQRMLKGVCELLFS